MTTRVLFVDDDPDVRAMVADALADEFQLTMVSGGAEALEALEASMYAVVLSDLRMPGMNGIQLLAEVCKRWPETVRMVLTSDTDFTAAMEAVNEGYVYRFMQKPCPIPVLIRSVQAGLDQYRLISAERRLLEQTLNGVIKTLADVLAVVSPSAFGRASRVRQLVGALARQLGVADVWEVEIAATLSQLGCVSVPEDTLRKAARGQPLAPPEVTILATHFQVGHDLIAQIPRLEGVAHIIRCQGKRYDGLGGSADEVRGDLIPIGARLLKLALDFDALVMAGRSTHEALAELHRRGGEYDPAAREAFSVIVQRRIVTYQKTAIDVHDLEPGMMFAEDVCSAAGILLVAKGQEVTPSLKARLLNIADTTGFKEPIRALVPAAHEPA
jgi:response regulator RpfG family c-di-GMP phosphodiesterase